MKPNKAAAISNFFGSRSTIGPSGTVHSSIYAIQTKVLLFCLVFGTLFVSPLFAASHYIRSGASGSANGNDWTNAYTELPVSLIRGDTYYVAGGNYTGRHFDTPASGTLVITVKGATIAEHGTDTGWDNSYSVENTPATWTSEVVFSSSYWVFDGSVGSMSYIPGDYGFSFGTEIETAVWVGTPSGLDTPTHTDITISHVYAKATTRDVGKIFLQGMYQAGVVNNVTVSHCLLDGWECGMMTRGLGGGTCNGWVFEYNVALNGSSTPAHHGEWINPNERSLTGLIVRYNIFEGFSGVNQTGTIVANNSDNIGANIYGNVFNGVWGSNGIITGTSAGDLVNAVIYNNTFLNCDIVTDFVISGPGSGNVAYNNLFYNMKTAMSSVAHDYNAFFSTTETPSESHRQTGSGNPFVNSAGKDFRLLKATAAGTPLPSPYDKDLYGNTRGADGVWDRGAFEFISGNPTKIPNPPTNLHYY